MGVSAFWSMSRAAHTVPLKRAKRETQVQTEQSSPVSQGAESKVVTRGNFLKATGGMVGFAALFGGVAGPALASGPDLTQSIINAALTAEQIATAFYYEGIAGPTASRLGPVHNSNNLNYFQAALYQEYQHIQLLTGLGAISLTGSSAPTLYFPNGTFDKADSFLSLLDTLENTFIGAYLAAVNYWATNSAPVYAEAAAQIMGVEAEHRALGRVTSGSTPPNNLVLEDALFTSVSDAVPVLLPFVQGGSGFTAVSFPSQSAIEAAVTQSITNSVTNPGLA